MLLTFHAWLGRRLSTWVLRLEGASLPPCRLPSVAVCGNVTPWVVDAEPAEDTSESPMRPVPLTESLLGRTLSDASVRSNRAMRYYRGRRSSSLTTYGVSEMESSP